MSDGSRQHKPTAPGQPGSVEAADAEVVPRQGGLFGADRMSAVNEEREEVRSSLRHRMGIMRKAEGVGRARGVPEGGGQPLPAGVRSKMEPRLGADLSAVRVHNSGESAEASTELGARAFTVGSDVHFGAGEFAPGTKEGDKLLAHELTHVVQGQKSGIQRKEAPDAAGGEHAGGHEVSDPAEPAEKEADHVADKVADDLHGGDKGKKKDDKKEKNGAHGGKAEDAAHPGHDGETAGAEHAKGDPHTDGHAAGDASASYGAPSAGGHDDAGAKEKAPAVAAKLASPIAPISARFFRVGTKIHRKPPPSSSPAPGPAPGSGGAKPGTPAKPNLKTPADVKQFCSPDPIAVQKLQDVDGETNVDPALGGPAKAKQEFYNNVMTYVNANPAVPANTIFNSCFNSAAGNLKFKGTKINPAAISRMCSRTCGLTGWWFDAVNKAPFEAQARSALGAGADADSISKTAQRLWKSRVKDGANVMASIDHSAAIKPKGQTWFSPDQIQIKAGSDAGFAELMRMNALQPEWFPEGTVSFEINPSAFHGEARKPTAYDGMQSAHWVSRPDGDTYGVTGGGVKEFLAQNVKCSGITTARATIPSEDLKGEIQTAMKKAYENALAMDPMLKQAIDNEKDPKKKGELQGLVPTLTDQLIRGDLSFGSIPKALRDIVGDTVKTTGLERQQPTKNKNPSGTGKRP